MIFWTNEKMYKRKGAFGNEIIKVTTWWFFFIPYFSYREIFKAQI